MPTPNFHLDINDKSVGVRLNVSPRIRFYACGFSITIMALVIWAILFLHGTGSPSMWHDLLSFPVTSWELIAQLFFLLSFSTLVGFSLWRYVKYAYPSDEAIQCNRSTLTISKVRWLDIHNAHWDTRSFALADIVDMRYQRIAEIKGTSIWGLCFIAGGRTERVLPGLKPREAEKILKALKEFSVDVPDDPTLSKKLAEETYA